MTASIWLDRGEKNFRQLSRELAEDIQPVLSEPQALRFQDPSTTGRTSKKGLVRKEADEVVVCEVQSHVDSDILEVLDEVAHQNGYKQGAPRGLGIPLRGPILDLNTMYKTKEKKVQPIHNSSVTPHKVEGRDDWQDRAGMRQPPNPDQTWRQFPHLIRDRTAPFPRGLRVTEERFEQMKIADWLWPKEVEMLKEVFWCREAALSFDFSEAGRIHPDVVPPVRLNTIPHEAWKGGSFPIPRKLRDEVGEMVQERLARGVLELSKSPTATHGSLSRRRIKDTCSLIMLSALTRLLFGMQTFPQTQMSSPKSSRGAR